MASISASSSCRSPSFVITATSILSRILHYLAKQSVQYSEYRQRQTFMPLTLSKQIRESFGEPRVLKFNGRLLLHSEDDGVGPTNTDGGVTLAYGFQGVLNLEEMAIRRENRYSSVSGETVDRKSSINSNRLTNDVRSSWQAKKGHQRRNFIGFSKTFHRSSRFHITRKLLFFQNLHTYKLNTRSGSKCAPPPLTPPVLPPQHSRFHTRSGSKCAPPPLTPPVLPPQHSRFHVYHL
ncbi:hypothetical protein Ccrd_005670, partial [Cynara cardunculus var. scolymus]